MHYLDFTKVEKELTKNKKQQTFYQLLC